MSKLKGLLSCLWGWLNEPPRRPDTYRAGDEEEKLPWRPGDDYSDHM